MNILISGGGTGGHIFPALAIANALRRKDPRCRILFVGAQGRMEMERVPAAGYDIEGLPVAGFDRRRPWRNIPVAWKLARSLWKARSIVRRFRPDVAVGVGGYASGPVLKEAQRRGIPTLLQEQNSYAGVTNKLLARRARAICVAYEGMERFFPAGAIELTGNPVRADITECLTPPDEARATLGFAASRPLVVVVGGSLGARTINDAMKGAMEAILASGANVLWQTGRLYAQECKAAAGELLRRYGRERLQVTPFVGRMDLAYRGATLIVARAGASTISELQLVGAPAILVPSPNVAEDHQRRNAEALASRQAAVMILDGDCRARLREEALALLADDKRREALSANARAMALAGADGKIADRVIALARENLKSDPSLK